MGSSEQGARVAPNLFPNHRVLTFDIDDASGGNLNINTKFKYVLSDYCNGQCSPPTPIMNANIY